ncbi:MAG: DUF2225 domain-containing protein [Peptococcia bacterium]
MSNLLYDKEIKCLLCDEKFIVQMIRNSKLAVSKRDTDFCNYYTNEENPYFYEIWVCPHCGFAFTASFKPLKPAQKEVVYHEYSKRATNTKLKKERDIEDAIYAFKLALICAGLSGQENVIIASLLLRLAWLYRFQDNKEEEEKYLAKAAEAFQVVYEKGDPLKNPLGEHKTVYLLGELNGRLGKFEEARRWFNLILSKRNIEPAIKNLARDQWMYYKSMME